MHGCSVTRVVQLANVQLGSEHLAIVFTSAAAVCSQTSAEPISKHPNLLMRLMVLQV